MIATEIERILTEKGVKPTANRIIVLDFLASRQRALSLQELETRLRPMDKSSIFRALTLFAEHHLVHTIDDGSGQMKYEMCHGEHHGGVGDMHVHFHCERCGRTFCLEDIPIPQVSLPEDFSVTSANYVVKGYCPDCVTD